MIGRSELLGILQESVHSFGVEVGQMVATARLSDEVLKLCGKRHERLDSRASSRHGHQRGWITMGGQKLREARSFRSRRCLRLCPAGWSEEYRGDGVSEVCGVSDEGRVVTVSRRSAELIERF